MTRAEFFNPELEHILPVQVSGPVSLILIGVWTLYDGRSYVRPLLRAIEEWKSTLADQQVVIAGDFNMNYKFDDRHPNRKYRFRDVVDLLDALDIKSLYHERRGELHGLETESTFFQYHHQDKPHHLDYVFASGDLRNRVTELSFGGFEEWHKLSDHVPVVATFAP